VSIPIEACETCGTVHRVGYDCGICALAKLVKPAKKKRKVKK
jgi:hypothetical protein